MSKRKQIICTVCAMAVLFGIFAVMYQKQQSKFPKETEPISATAFKLNTVVKLTIYDSQDEALLTEALALCDKYEEIFSRTKASSELYRLNSGQLPSTERGIAISPDMAELIAKGLEYGRLSNGAFDIAIEPVSSLGTLPPPRKSCLTRAAYSRSSPCKLRGHSLK